MDARLAVGVLEPCEDRLQADDACWKLLAVIARQVAYSRPERPDLIPVSQGFGYCWWSLSLCTQFVAAGLCVNWVGLGWVGDVGFGSGAVAHR